MMYVIRDKQTKQVIHISQPYLGAISKAEDVYPGFDPKTMELGKTDKSYIPAYFNINAQGEVAELTLEEQVAAGIPVMGPHQKLVGGKIVAKTLKELVEAGVTSLEAICKQKAEAFSALAFEERRKLIPDYKLENAALGVYDAQTTANYRATVQAFRDEVHRLQALVEEAKTMEEIEAIAANFPKEIVVTASG